MNSKVQDVCARLVQEIEASIKKHGDWSDYAFHQMDNATFCEWLEMGEAIDRSDITGEHGVIREALQTAACLVKWVIQMEARMKLFCDDGHEWFGDCLPAVCPRCHMPAVGARQS